MQRDVRAYAWDIFNAVESIQSFAAGKSFEDYRNDPMLRSAVERQLEIIGEALSQALRLFPELEKRITGCRQIIGLRNRLIHGYSDISQGRIWRVIEEYLPTETRGPGTAGRGHARREMTGTATGRAGIVTGPPPQASPAVRLRSG